MNRHTFAFLAGAIGIAQEDYPIFFNVSAADIAAAELVNEKHERALLDWQETHASYVDYALLCFRLWHRQDLLGELMESYAAAHDLSALHAVTEDAQYRYGPHFMDELTKLITQIEVVIPDREYFTALSADGLVTAPTYGMHISVFQHATVRAQREGLRVEILDSAGSA